MTPPYNDDIITAWLDNTLPDEDAADFEDELDDSPALRDRVERHKHERAAQREQRAAAYGAELAEWHRARMRARRAWVKWAVAIAAVGVVLWWGGVEVKEQMEMARVRAAFVQDSIQRAQHHRDSVQKAEARAAFVRDSIQRAQEQQRANDSLNVVALKAALVQDSIRKVQAQQREAVVVAERERAARVQDSLRADSMAAVRRLQVLRSDRNKQPLPTSNSDTDPYLEAAERMAALSSTHASAMMDTSLVKPKSDDYNDAAPEPEVLWKKYLFDDKEKNYDKAYPALVGSAERIPYYKALIKTYHQSAQPNSAKVAVDLFRGIRLAKLQRELPTLTQAEFDMHQAVALSKSGDQAGATQILRKNPAAMTLFDRYANTVRPMRRVIGPTAQFHLWLMARGCC